VPKAVVNEKNSAPTMMDEVVERLGSALLKVVSNKGAAGPDGNHGAGTASAVAVRISEAARRSA
jgi:hypothetical protein